MARNKNNNIDKAMQALGDALKIEEIGQEIQLPGEEVSTKEQGYEIAEMADGGAEVNFDPNAPIDKSQVPFDANLVEYLDESTATKLSNDLVAAFEMDKDSRKDWEDTYVKGLDMLGFKYENRTQPFEGASGVVHPLLAESVTQFQAQAYKELLPQAAPYELKLLEK